MVPFVTYIFDTDILLAISFFDENIIQRTPAVLSSASQRQQRKVSETYYH